MLTIHFNAGLLGENFVDGVLTWWLRILERTNLVELLLHELLELGLALSMLTRLARFDGARGGAHGGLATSARHARVRHRPALETGRIEYLTRILLSLLLLIIVQYLLHITICMIIYRYIIMIYLTTIMIHPYVYTKSQQVF